MAGQLPVVNLYPQSNYVVTSKQPKNPEKDDSVAAYYDRLEHRYEQEGTQTSVYGVILVHMNNRPHVWLLVIEGDPIRKELPGGRLRPGENEIDGLKRKLCSKLGPNSPSSNQDWQIGECLGVWWRPNFDIFLYPHCPPHIIADPKECKKLYLVHLPEHRHIYIPTNRMLVCTPLLDLFVNTNKHKNHVIYYIPDQLSRFQLNMVPQNPPDGDNAGTDNEVTSDDNHVAIDDN